MSANIIKELLWRDIKVVKECSILKMVIGIKDNIYKENSTAKVNIFGIMELHIKVILKMVEEMVVGYGNLLEILMIFTKDSIWMIWNMVKVSIFGQMDRYMKEHFIMIKNMEKVQFYIKMVKYPNWNGKMAMSLEILKNIIKINMYSMLQLSKILVKMYQSIENIHHLGKNNNMFNPNPNKKCNNQVQSVIMMLSISWDILNLLLQLPCPKELLLGNKIDMKKNLYILKILKMCLKDIRWPKDH